MELKPGYKQTEVGVIPEDWNACQLGRLLQFQNGRGFQQGEWSRTGLPIIRIQNLNDSEAEFNFFNGHIEERHLVQPGDLLFAWSGTVGSSFGPRIWRGETGVLNQHIFKVSPFSKMLSSPYALRLLESAASHIASQSHGFKASFVHVKKRDLEKIVAAFPPCQEEQKRICEALAVIDAYLDATEAEVNKKRDIKQAAMQELLTGKRRLPGFEGEWEVKRLGDVGTFFKGSGVTRDQSQGGQLACIRYGELYTAHDNIIREIRSWILPAVAEVAFKLKSGDILFAGSGETKEEIGKCAAFVDHTEAYAGGDIIVLRPKDCDSRFLGYFLNSSSIARQKANRGQGDAVVHISSSALSGIVFKIPDRQEQASIADILVEMDSEIVMLKQRLSKTRAIKQAMMQELLTGRIRLR
jgi:type I restriction enzyme S subunit